MLIYLFSLGNVTNFDFFHFWLKVKGVILLDLSLIKKGPWVKKFTCYDVHILNLQDKSLSNGTFFLDLLSAVEPRSVNWSLVTKGESGNYFEHCNCRNWIPQNLFLFLHFFVLLSSLMKVTIQNTKIKNHPVLFIIHFLIVSSKLLV